MHRQGRVAATGGGGHHGAGGDDHLHAFTHGHFQFDDFLLRQHQKKSAGRVGGGGDEDGPEFLADLGLQIAPGLVGEKADRVDTLARNSTSTTLVKRLRCWTENVSTICFTVL